MTVFWEILAVLAFCCAAAGAALVRFVRRKPSWHPGDEFPDVPPDAGIRRFRG